MGDRAKRPVRISDPHGLPRRKEPADYTARPPAPANASTRIPRGFVLQQILPLRGAIQNYEWGSRTTLAALLGHPGPTDRPEAELWLGAHPRGPAEALVGGRWERLDTLIERDADSVLGLASIASFGRRLPFLLKLLAVAKPLSLQAHPDAEQARTGFAREQKRRPGATAVYADPYPKPELICALTPFRALCGFRPLAEVRAGLVASGLGALVPDADDEAAGLAGFLRNWLATDPPVRDAALEQAIETAGRAAPGDHVAECLMDLAAEHPGDPGILAPLFLHLVELAPGEALFLAPGELHCYLAGAAVELMASSDNVLRGGLTSKAIHVDELLRVATFVSRRPQVRRAQPVGPGLAVWPSPAAEFELSLLAPAPDTEVQIQVRAGAEILHCADGELRIVAAGADGVVVSRGESCLVPAAVGPYRVAGSGRAFRAALPSSAAP